MNVDNAHFVSKEAAEKYAAKKRKKWLKIGIGERIENGVIKYQVTCTQPKKQPWG